MLKGEKTSKAGRGKRVDYYNLRRAYIIDSTSTFCTRCVMVRYADENIELQDVCQYRTELDIIPGKDLQSMCIEAELMFADQANVGPVEILYASQCEVLLRLKHRPRKSCS